MARYARKQQEEIDYIRMKLEKAENSGITTNTKTDILIEA